MGLGIRLLLSCKHKNRKISFDFFSNGSSQVPKDLIQENNGSEGDDDDEFSEFQSAVPVSNSSISFDLLNSNPIGATATATNSTPFYNNSTITQSNVTPAIAAEPKKADPFSSLFSTAKASSEVPITPKVSQTNASSSKSLSNNTTALNMNQNDDDDDDDEFGEMHGGAVQQEQNTTNKGTSSNEIDLLSF